MTLSLYSFEDKDGNEWGTFTTQDYQEAKKYAAENNLRVVENIYEWSEAIPAEGDDYTPQAECPLCGEPIEPGDETEESGAGTVHKHCQDGTTNDDCDDDREPI